jgi:hypothetical protein
MTTRITHPVRKLLGLTAATLLVSCALEEVPHEDEEIAASEQAIAPPPSTIAPEDVVRGLCPGIVPIDFASERCDLTQLAELMDGLATSGLESNLVVHDFLDHHIRGRAVLQCSSYLDAATTKYCVDVVDKDPLGGPLDQGAGVANFFAAYVDNDGPPSVPYWDARLSGPVRLYPPPNPSPMIDFRLDPVLLEHAGTFNIAGGWSPLNAFDHKRVLIFDPHECPPCVGKWYGGPGQDYVNPAKACEQIRDYGWFPRLVKTGSGRTTKYQLEEYDGSFVDVTRTVFESETLYRTRGTYEDTAGMASKCAAVGVIL